MSNEMPKHAHVEWPGDVDDDDDDDGGEERSPLPWML